MILGGTIIRSNYLEIFNETMAKFRHDLNMKMELKWSKVSKNKLNEYKTFIDHFFALNNSDLAHFHCLIIDNHRVNHRRFNQGNQEVGFYKFYYQLLLHSFGRRYYRRLQNTKFLIYLDKRTSNYKLDDLTFILNNGINKRYRIPTKPYLKAEPRDSKLNEVLQLNDIVLGSIGYHKNGYHLLSNSSPAKIELANYISQKTGYNNLGQNTTFGQKRFTIWNFDLK